MDEFDLRGMFYKDLFCLNNGNICTMVLVLFMLDIYVALQQMFSLNESKSVALGGQNCCSLQYCICSTVIPTRHTQKASYSIECEHAEYSSKAGCPNITDWTVLDEGFFVFHNHHSTTGNKTRHLTVNNLLFSCSVALLISLFTVFIPKTSKTDFSCFTDFCSLI